LATWISRAETAAAPSRTATQTARETIQSRAGIGNFLPCCEGTVATYHIGVLVHRFSCPSSEEVIDVAANHEPNGAPEFADRYLAQAAVVATTGRAVSAGSCGSGGIRWVTLSPCGKRNYSRHKNLRKTPPKNFKTGSFDRSDTSPFV
jgi:hypothetical protein